MIILNEKDADFVANVVRELINKAEASARLVKKDAEKIFEKSKKMTALLSDDMKTEMHLEMVELYNSTVDEVDQKLSEEIVVYTRIIELMYRGSNG